MLADRLPSLCSRNKTSTGEPTNKPAKHAKQRRDWVVCFRLQRLAGCRDAQVIVGAHAVFADRVAARPDGTDRGNVDPDHVYRALR
jgi:hypothetical protein